jgi:outer membrane biosynthesis protein TonB
MKNPRKMTSSVGSYLSNRILIAVLLSIAALAAAVPSQAQRTTFTMPRFTPPTQTYRPPAQTYHPPAQTQSRPAPTSRPAQSPSTPRTTGSTPQPRPETTQPRPSAPSRKEVDQHEKAQARAQKEEQKQNQKQQKEQARQQKEQARQQKELQKKQKSDNKVAKSVKAPKARSTSPSVAKAPASKAPVNNAGAKSSTGASSTASQTQIERLNASRSNMTGINRRPLPAGEVTVHPNGRMTLKAEGGRQYGLRANGTIASYSDREKTVSFDKQGKVSSIHTASMDIHNGAHGQRTIISHRADGSKVVSTGRHSGYVERNVVMNNRSYVQRTTVINQRVYTRTFLANGFGGVAFVPPAFFAPGFYGWAYYPWAAPISFTWGWFGAPWYAGPYFVASPRYPSAAFWLTDYMIGETLATAYQLHHDAAGFDDVSDDMSGDGSAADLTDAGTSADGDSAPETARADATTPITAELKAELAEEIRQQLTNDNAEATNPSQASFDMLPAALSTPNHVFVVSNDLDVTTTDQQLCALQAGDMLQLMTPAASDSGLVELRVASSKRLDCPAGVLVSVSLTDLQEMQNSFQAQIEAGLGTLRDNQGRNGLPSAPPDAVSAPPRPVTGLAPFSAADSAVALDQQREQADQAEKLAASGSL